ncbi:unnamed protein product [Heterobilharzia americana]|nr:unnamed protein product [Heterobilharzia americana]CAH8592612.1 unnamed protein product [Heterobilharzia americana]
MEAKLSESLSRMLSSPKVTAVQCIDSEGLCISSQGIVNDQTSGILSSIYKHAAGIEESTDPPVLVIEYESKLELKAMGGKWNERRSSEYTNWV